MAFADHNDVSNRLGRDLSDAEKDTVAATVALVEALCGDAVGRDANWATALDPVPGTLKALAIDKSVVAITNPGGAETTSETLGAYRYTQGFTTDANGAVALTDAEERRVRRAVYGTNVAAPRLNSVLDDVYDTDYGS